jgi:excisionase family DNA binding protein
MPSASARDSRPPFDYDDAARYLNTTSRHLRELAYRREIAVTKVGRLVRFLPADLDAYLASRRVEAS